MVLNTHKHLVLAGFGVKCARRDVKRMASMTWRRCDFPVCLAEALRYEKNIPVPFCDL